MTPLIRPANPDHLPELARLHSAAFADAWDASVLSRMMAREGAIALVAGDGKPEAFILAQLAADECEVLTLVTGESARRKGLARALLLEAAALAHERGAQTLYLEAAEDNAPALALYRGLGFQARGRRRSYYRRNDKDAIDAVLFEAALPL